MSIVDLPEAFLRTIMHQVATLLLPGAGGDPDAAWNAAAETIRSFAPQTEAELRLAARIIAFSLQAGEALAQAADPGAPLNRVLRLRSGAVALSREAEKAERRLDMLRKARLEEAGPRPKPPRPRAAQADPEPGTLAAAPAIASAQPPASVPAPASFPPIDDIGEIATYANTHGLTWTQAFRQRQRERSLAERHRKHTAETRA